MTAIVHHLPFSEKEDEVHVGLQRVPIKPYQIILWVNLTAREVLELPPDAPRFPAILDTAHNHNFSIQSRHLTHWARVQPASLPRLRWIREGGRLAPVHAGHVWIHPNVPGKRDEFSGAPAFRLRLDQGLAVHPDDLVFPRLPLLGLRALVRNKPHFAMDPERCLVDLHTPGWRTRLVRWFS